MDRLAELAERFADHQFDDVPLTMSEIKTIREVLCSTMVSMLHARVAYPKREEREPEIEAERPARPAA